MFSHCYCRLRFGRISSFFGARELVERMYCAYLETEDLGLDQGEGLAVNLDEALALL